MTISDVATLGLSDPLSQLTGIVREPLTRQKVGVAREPMPTLTRLEQPALDAFPSLSIPSHPNSSVATFGVRSSAVGLESRKSDARSLTDTRCSGIQPVQPEVEDDECGDAQDGEPR